MRAFDNWNSYFNNDGHLLHGKIRYCRKGTTDDVVIYNTNGIPLRNPEFTDLLGRSEYQVFINDDVTAYYYQYIGTGDMTRFPGEDYSPSRWSLQYTSDDIDPIKSVEIESNGASGVANMTELRNVDPASVPVVNGVKMIWLYGYYASGDCSPVLYVWDSASDVADDGGAVIASYSVPGLGRWKLATRELHFDVRHYGVFPTNDIYSTNYAYTSQLANCAAYLDSQGLDAWFPALEDDLSYYLFNGTNTFSILGDIYISDRVRFQCKTDTQNTAITCHEIHKSTPHLFVSNVQTGFATLTADWINVSWVGGNCTGNARVGWVIDASDVVRTISNKEVHFVTNGAPSLQLVNCVITSNKQITGEITIQDSVLKSDYFADDYDWRNLTSINNDIRLVNCKDANTYVLLKNKQHDPHYGDLGEQTLQDVKLLSNAIVENAIFDGVTLQNAVEMHNVSGSVVMYGSSVALNAVDCWLFVQNECVVDSIAVRRGSLSGANIQVLSNLFLDNVDLNAQLKLLGASATIQNSTINAKVYATDISLVSNTINSLVEQTDTDSVVQVDVRKNKFFGPNGIHRIAPSHANTVVNGCWVDNHAEGGSSSYHPIRLEMTLIRNQDALHSYVYEGNTGKFLPKRSRYAILTADVRMFDNPTHASSYQAMYPTAMPLVSLIRSGLIYASSDGTPLIAGVYVKDGASFPMPFFAIGQCLVNVKTTVTLFFDGAYISGSGMSEPFATAFNKQTVSVERFTSMITATDPLTYDASNAVANTVMGPAYVGVNRWSKPGWAGGGEHTQGDPGTASICIELS